jgi:hypothetical protein
VLFVLGHYALMHAVSLNPKLWEHQKQGPPPAIIFSIFQWFYLAFYAWFASSGILNLISGFCLRARRCRTFSLVVAGVNCLHLPLGTVLGVFTIIVLSRESVREAYDARQGPQTNSDPSAQTSPPL